MSQTARVLAHLQSGKTITPLEALRIFGCMRLQGRIWELKEKGYNIKTTMIKINGKQVARYSLEDLFSEVKEPVENISIFDKRQYIKRMGDKL